MEIEIPNRYMEIEIQKRIVVTVAVTPDKSKVWIEFGDSLSELRLTVDQAESLMTAISKTIAKINLTAP